MKQPLKSSHLQNKNCGLLLKQTRFIAFSRENQPVPEFRFNWYTVTGGDVSAEFIPRQPNPVFRPVPAPLTQLTALATPKVRGPKASTSAAPAPSLASSTLSPPSTVPLSPTASTSGTMPKPPIPSPLTGSSSNSSSSSPQPVPETKISTHQLRPHKDVNYWELHLGKTLLLGTRGFLNRCNTTQKYVGKTVQQTAKSLQICWQIPSHLLALLVLLYGHLKITSGSTVMAPDPELMNAQNFNFAKPKLFFKNIGCYAATSTYIHVCIPFNFTSFQHKKCHHRGLPEATGSTWGTFQINYQVSHWCQPGNHRRLIRRFPRYHQSAPSKVGDLNARITKALHCHQHLDCGHGHVHLQHSEDHTTQWGNQHFKRKKLTWYLTWYIYTKNICTTWKRNWINQTNLADLLKSNIWFSSKVTDAIEKKFQSVVQHHKNVVKSAQHHRLALGALLHDVMDGIISHVVQVAKKKNLIQFVKFASVLFQFEISHLYTWATNKFTLILHIPMVSNTNLLNLYEFLPLPIHFNFATNISITLDVGTMSLLAIGHSQSFQTISSSDIHTCLHLGDTFFCKGRKVIDGNQFEKIFFRRTSHGQLTINPDSLPIQNC